MDHWTKNELLKELSRLGYEVDASMSFNYNNNLNRKSYKARSIYIRETSSGLGCCNIHARRDANFKALQDIRFSVEVIDRGRTWEL